VYICPAENVLATTGDKSGRNTSLNNTFEHPTKQVALTKSLMTRARECRVVKGSCPQYSSGRTTDTPG
jgi:hypothetical protein